MKNLVYISTAVKLLEDEQLINILTAARNNNLKHHVTGVLLYSDGTFIQVLEGEAGDVDTIMSKIETDPKHKNLITLIDEPIQQRNFPDWSMGFYTPKADKLADLIGYLRSTDKIEAKGDSGAAVITLKTFIESNKLSMSY
ncbi:BLUF domain-containing protein [Mucilaginibacter terrigena]|uniref:BLUF domain-containing protein n=1 Tax=Mucilaginibacter terrigena TaxID=2492395 RepID=A0A4Q5LPB3_9SPHI|nr:BLUF domain-containing protein [Mucilaginibacter terrigena]RYU91225.1 BLUF domain-containing protein [Mucilaginibacter terrigena]